MAESLEFGLNIWRVRLRGSSSEEARTVEENLFLILILLKWVCLVSTPSIKSIYSLIVLFSSIGIR